MASKKILIIYLSRTNNKKAVAEMIQKQVGGTLVALELVTPYPADYHTMVQQVVKENETGYLPPLKTRIDSIGSYDVIFVGFPTWDMQMPPPVKSFLKQYDLSGKTVIPFNTNAVMEWEAVSGRFKSFVRTVRSWRGFLSRPGSRGTAFYSL